MTGKLVSLDLEQGGFNVHPKMGRRSKAVAA
jgi:hypothetical protein